MNKIPLIFISLGMLILFGIAVVLLWIGRLLYSIKSF